LCYKTNSKPVCCFFHSFSLFPLTTAAIYATADEDAISRRQLIFLIEEISSAASLQLPSSHLSSFMVETMIKSKASKSISVEDEKKEMKINKECPSFSVVLLLCVCVW
jgi:hypothetical protein